MTTLARAVACALLNSSFMRPSVASCSSSSSASLALSRRSLPLLLPLALVLAATAGCNKAGSSSSASADSCGPAAVAGVYAEAPAYGGGWYDVGDVWVIGDAPGVWDDGSSGGGDGSEGGDDSSGDDGSSQGDDDSSGDDSSGDDSSGDDSSGDDSSGDDSSASKRIHPRTKHGHLRAAGVHVTGAMCAACTVTCAIEGAGGGVPAAVSIDGASSVSADDACCRAQRSAMTYAHASYGRRVVSCARGAPDASTPAAPAPHTPASPHVAAVTANSTETQ